MLTIIYRYVKIIILRTNSIQINADLSVRRGESEAQKMEVKGYYIWCRNKDDEFLTIFLPTVNYDIIEKYFERNQELELLDSLFGGKYFDEFIEKEKNELLNLFLELNNL